MKYQCGLKTQIFVFDVESKKVFEKKKINSMSIWTKNNFQSRRISHLKQFSSCGLIFYDTLMHNEPYFHVGYVTKNEFVRLRKSRHANLCSKISFFVKTLSLQPQFSMVIAFSELRPGSNERYENSKFYGPFRILISSLYLIEKTIL